MSSPGQASITSVLKETRLVPAAGGVRGRRRTSRAWRNTKSSGNGPTTIRTASGPSRPKSLDLVPAVGPRCSIGRSRTPSGSSAASSTPATTASTAICSGRGANKAAIIWEGEPGDTPRAALSGSAPRGLQVRQRPQEARHQAGRPRHHLHADGPRSWPSPCWPAPASARCTASSSAASRAEAVADRNNDAKAKLIITADGGWRRGKVVPLKQNVDAALEKSPTVEKCIVFNRCNQQVDMKPGRDFWWHELMADASADCPAEPLDSEHPLFILYTSGSTGKPKGVLHTTAGYLLGVSLTHKWVFDLNEDDTYWCTADVGWVTGHSYIVYGPLANGATDGHVRRGPEPSARGSLLGDHRKIPRQRSSTPPRPRSAPSSNGAITWPAKHDLSSLRLLGTVGEPINPEAWMWYHEVIGKRTLPHRRHLVADRDRHDHDRPAAGRHRHQARLGDQAVARASWPRSSISHGQAGAGRTGRLPGHHASPGRPCCGPSSATMNAIASNTGRRCRTSTSPPTAPARTRTATSGSWAASMTCSTCPAIA